MLDNEALQALSAPDHPKHRLVVAYLEAANGRNSRHAGTATVLVPTVVRVEAAIDRRAPSTASLARFRVADVTLDLHRADRAAALRRAGGSAVDACVAEVAASVMHGEITVLTADLSDLPSLLGAAGASRVQVHRI